MTTSPATHDSDETAPHQDQAAVREEQAAAHAAEARRVRRPRDMALSLGVLLVPILLIILVGRFLYGDSTVATVDPGLALQGAARAGMQPIPLATAPGDWKIVSARFGDGVLRIGYLDPAQEGVQLVQGRSSGLIAQELGDDARRSGDIVAGGRTWSRWAARDGISALARTDGATTIILLGPVGTDELTALAAAVTR